MSEPIRIEDLSEEARAYLGGAHDRITARLDGILGTHGKRPGLGRALAIGRVEILEAEMAPVWDLMADAGTPVACAKGCGCCCSLTIEVTPDEVFALTTHLAATLAPADLAAVQARAAANDAHAHGLEPLARHRLRLPCPVLDPASQACLGHAARPTACQGYLSVDLAKCEADHRDPPQYVTRPTLSDILTDLARGIGKAVTETAGLSTRPLELTAALVAAWADDGAEARWLAGEDVLATAGFYDAAPSPRPSPPSGGEGEIENPRPHLGERAG